MRRFTTGSRLLSCALAVAVVTAPIHAAYAGPVEDLYTEGQEKFEAGDFGAAGERWAQAVRAVDEGPDSATRQTIMNLALDAFLRAYQADDDRKHIDAAAALLVEYEAILEGSGVELSPEIVSEKGKIDKILAELDKPVEEVEEDTPVEVVEPSPVEEPIDDKAGQGLVIGGGVMIGVGAVGLGLLLGGVIGGASAQKAYDSAENGTDEQSDAETRGKTMNILAIAGGVVAPLALGAGVALLIIGLKRNKEAQGRAMITPAFGPSYTGLTLTARF